MASFFFFDDHVEMYEPCGPESNISRSLAIFPEFGAETSIAAVCRSTNVFDLISKFFSLEMYFQHYHYAS